MQTPGNSPSIRRSALLSDMGCEITAGDNLTITGDLSGSVKATAGTKDAFGMDSGGEVTAIHVSGVSLFMGYQGELEKHAESHSVSGEFRWVF